MKQDGHRSILLLRKSVLSVEAFSSPQTSSYNSASSADCAPAGGAADLAFGGPGYTNTIDSGPAHAASDGDLSGYASRLRKRRGRHGLR